MSNRYDNKLINRMVEEMEKRSKKVTDLARETGIPKDRIYKWLQQGNNPKAEDARLIQAWLNGEKMEESPSSASKQPSAMEILGVLAEAFRNQASAINTQAAIMRNIEQKMARESSLQEVLAGVETIADRQGPAIQKILADLAELKGRGNPPS